MAASVGVEGGEEGALGVGLGEAGVGVERVFDAVLPLLLGQDVHGALVAGEEVRAVLGVEEGLQRADAGDEEDEVVLAAELEAGVDDVVADALVAEVDLEAVGEEGEEIVDRRLRSHLTRNACSTTSSKVASRRVA